MSYSGKVVDVPADWQQSIERLGVDPETLALCQSIVQQNKAILDMNAQIIESLFKSPLVIRKQK